MVIDFHRFLILIISLDSECAHEIRWSTNEAHSFYQQEEDLLSMFMQGLSETHLHITWQYFSQM